MMTLRHYDVALEAIRKPTGDPQVDKMFEQVAVMVEQFRNTHQEVTHELLNMYLDASEHNIDIDREAVYRLTLRMA